MSLKLRQKIAQIGHTLKQGSIRLLSPIREFIQEYVVGRWKYFYRVRRFAFGWLAFASLIVFGGAFQTLSLINSQREAYPLPGGSLREGVVGDLSNFNPLFAGTSADRAASALLFDSLLSYNDNGRLQSELALSWKSNEDADVYTVTLKDDLLWHDGEALTADDVVFTVELMKDPRLGVESLQNIWTGVEVEKMNDMKIAFRLPNSLAPFPPLLRFGVVPEHILSGQPVESLRSHSFNQQPVGSGPFVFNEFNSEENSLLLSANSDYHQSQPRLDRYQLRAYENELLRLEAMENGQIDFYASDQPATGEAYDQHVARLGRTRYLFFNTRTNRTTNDTKLRQALARAINPLEFDSDADETIQGMLLRDQLKLDGKYHQLAFNPKKSMSLLDNLNWRRPKDSSVRENNKDSQLRFDLVYPDRPREQQQARKVRDQLRNVGVAVDLVGLNQEEFNQAIFIDRDFDMVLASVDSGLDPDVFVYWHSSQTDEGNLNISGIRDDDMDRALASGRTRSSDRLRKAKYQTAAAQWRSQAPAVSLSQDNYYIISRSRVRAFDGALIANTIDRYNDVENWTAQVTEQLPANYDSEQLNDSPE